jgi:hypothetical protein
MSPYSPLRVNRRWYQTDPGLFFYLEDGDDIFLHNVGFTFSELQDVIISQKIQFFITSVARISNPKIIGRDRMNWPSGNSIEVVRIPPGAPNILSEVFRNIPQSLRANSMVVPR